MSSESYPALLDLTAQKLYPIHSAESFLVGRNETADVCVIDLSCSRHQFRIVRQDSQYFVEALSRNNATLCNGQTVTGRLLLRHEAQLSAGNVHFQFLLRPAAPDRPSRVAPPVPVRAAPGQVAAPSSEQDSFPLAGTMLIGREIDQVQVLLPHPQVSRVHARITLEGHQARLSDLNSANGTFVNGRRLSGSIVLESGDQIDIGPFALQFTGSALTSRPRSDNVELVVQGVRRVVTNRETGKPLVLLDDISLVIRPREFVCLLGPSGSGKSTLLSSLSGRTSTEGGAVLLNGRDVCTQFEMLKQDMAVVPQKDILHEGLSVGQALWYTARLRLPADTRRHEIEHCLSELLDTVGLSSRRATLIRHLSGGQVKRASLANEILCKPSLLFLDEVTSGLDEQTDREMMNLFRSLADAGKTVVCITHSLANVERTCHLVVILTTGGKLAFVGKPAEALQYFRIERLGDVYDRLAEQPAEHWQRAFQKSAYCKRYVTDRLPRDQAPPPVSTEAAHGVGHVLSRFFRQSVLLSRRYFAIWWGDYLALLAMMGQSLLVAGLIGIVFGDLDKAANPSVQAHHSVTLLFLLAVSSFWFGCNNAAKEIVKERIIYSRERDFNLLIGSYYVSKLLLLTLFSSLQVLLLYGVARVWCNVPGSYGRELGILLALSLAGVSLGLTLSALARTEELAITFVPMVIIPQIILSGMLVPLEGLGEKLARACIATYWGKRSLDGCLPANLAKLVPLEQHSTTEGLIVLLAHAAVGVVTTLLLLYVQGQRSGVIRRLLVGRS